MRAEVLMSTPSVVIRRVDHDEEYVPTVVEFCKHYAVNFVESGEFSITARGQRSMLRAGDALVCRPETERTYEHSEETCADVCTSIVFTSDIAGDMERHGWRSDVVTSTNNLAFLRWRLGRMMSAGDAMGLEEWAGDLTDAIRRPMPPSPLHRPAQLSWYAQRVDEIRRMLQVEYGEEHSLTSLARLAGMSPFHFARVFRELVGTPPHRYLRRVRLERATEMLLDGASVTSTCYDVGFSNLSHFIRSFRRRFGCAPSELRKKVQATDQRTAS